MGDSANSNTSYYSPNLLTSKSALNPESVAGGYGFRIQGRFGCQEIRWVVASATMCGVSQGLKIAISIHNFSTCWTRIDHLVEIQKGIIESWIIIVPQVEVIMRSTIGQLLINFRNSTYYSIVVQQVDLWTEVVQRLINILKFTNEKLKKVDQLLTWELNAG